MIKKEIKKHRASKKNKSRDKRRKRNTNNKKIIIVLVVIIIGVISIFSILTINKNIKENKIKEAQNELKTSILSHYNEYVVTNKETTLYKYENNEYLENGKIGPVQELTLDKINVTYQDEYLKVTSFEEEYYIYYKDVEKIDTLSTYEKRYEKYIPFNQNIVTKSTTNFYDEKNNLIYKINKSYSFPIIIKYQDKYGVEYNDRLMYVLSEDVDKIIDNKNTEETIATRVRTLAYHRIYDPNTESCNEVICHTEKQFESHIKYLSDNNYLTLTTKELEQFIDGIIQIPKKSVVLTIDDGTMDKRAIPILEKYKINASLFLVTIRFKEQDYIDFTSDYLELHSHSHNMHWAGECAGYGNQGGGILCLPKERVLEDLKTSQEILKGSTVFCYPFYDYSTRAINLLKEAGYTMAFAGLLNTNGYTYVGTNKMLIPRVTIVSYTTFEQFKNYVN